MDEWILSRLYQRTHSAGSRSTSRSPAQFRPCPAGVMHSVLYSPIVDSSRALSSASPIVPIDPAMPASASSSVNASAVYCEAYSLLNRIRFNSDYAEPCVKSRDRVLACAGGVRSLIPRLNDEV